MGLTRQQAMDKYLGIVKDAIDAGLRPRCHFEDITRADFYGFVVPFATALMRLSEDSGIPVKIRACDTMGYGIPLHCRDLYPVLSMVCSTMQVFRVRCSSGTAITTSIRAS